MGDRISFITMYGLRHPWNNDFAAAYDEIYDHDNAPYVICDGLLAEWIYVGVPLFNISQEPPYNDNGSDNWVPFKAYNLNDLFLEEYTYRERFVKKLPEWKHMVDGNFQIFAFDYWL